MHIRNHHSQAGRGQISWSPIEFPKNEQNEIFLGGSPYMWSLFASGTSYASVGGFSKAIDGFTSPFYLV